jgi:hypothetical protein
MAAPSAKIKRYAAVAGDLVVEETEFRQGDRFKDTAVHSMPWQVAERAVWTDPDGFDVTLLVQVRSMWAAARQVAEMVGAYRAGQLDGSYRVAGEHPVSVWSDQWDRPNHQMSALSRMSFEGAVTWFRENGIGQVAHVGTGGTLAHMGDETRTQRAGTELIREGSDQRRLTRPDYLSLDLADDTILLGDDGTGTDGAAADEHAYLAGLPDTERSAYLADRSAA